MEPELKYLPSEWLDEVIPPPQTHPNAFLSHTEGLGWFIRDEDEGECEWEMKVEPGDVVLFSAHENFGMFVLTVKADGSYETDRVVPEKASHFMIYGDIDTLSGSISDLIAGYGFDGQELEPGSYDVWAYWWSNEDYRFRFEIVDGKGVFVAEGVLQ